MPSTWLVWHFYDYTLLGVTECLRGILSVEDSCLAGRPKSVVAPENISAVLKCITYAWYTLEVLARIGGVSTKAVHDHEGRRSYNFVLRWIPVLWAALLPQLLEHWFSASPPWVQSSVAACEMAVVTKLHSFVRVSYKCIYFQTLFLFLKPYWKSLFSGHLWIKTKILQKLLHFFLIFVPSVTGCSSVTVQ